MHREIRTVDEPFRPATPVGLYAFTAVVGGLLAADLWPLFAGWLRGQGVELTTWGRELAGYRFALIAAPQTIRFTLLVIVLMLAGTAVSALGSGLTLRRFLRV